MLSQLATTSKLKSSTTPSFLRSAGQKASSLQAKGAARAPESELPMAASGLVVLSTPAAAML
jgi:hypothetical protein